MSRVDSCVVRVSSVVDRVSHMCIMVMKTKHISAHIRMTDFKGHTINMLCFCLRSHVMYIRLFSALVQVNVCMSVRCVIYGVVRVGVALNVDIPALKQVTLYVLFYIKTNLTSLFCTYCVYSQYTYYSYICMMCL